MNAHATLQTITLGGGCFWCLEAAYRHIPGVQQVTSGYMGGSTPSPTYEQVCSGKTGHAEVVQVQFDPEKTKLTKILDFFWKLHDPTQLNRQGNDIGTQYRSVIFFHSPEQEAMIQASLAQQRPLFSKPIVTQVLKAPAFYPAEDYHQNYYALNQGKNPYCQFTIKPKLEKVGLCSTAPPAPNPK